MRVLLAGDTHGNLRHFKSLFDVALREGCDRIVQVGDFGYWPHMFDFAGQIEVLCRTTGVSVYWLDGNHENFDALADAVDVDADSPQLMFDEDAEGKRLWYLPRGCTWTWDGCRFMALGGAHSIDKDDRVEGYSWWRQEMLTREQVERAMSRGPVDVLLTHDVPEGVCPIIEPGYKGDEFSRGNRLAVNAVMEAVRPRLLVHGHMHHRYSGRLGNVQVEGLAQDNRGRDSWMIIYPDQWATGRYDADELDVTQAEFDEQFAAGEPVEVTGPNVR